MINARGWLEESDSVRLIPCSVLETCLKSLYWDQILPTETDILRRIGELYPSSRLPESLGSQLSSSNCRWSSDCHENPYGRRVVEFRVAPAWFLGWVDPNDSNCHVEERVWSGLCHYVLCGASHGHSSENTGESTQYQFRGGRYGFAKKLQECVLSVYAVADLGNCVSCEMCSVFFESVQFYSLGRLCQLVQLAISHGILRYEDNVLQPGFTCKQSSAAYASKLSLPPAPETFDSSKVTREIETLVDLERYIEALFRDERLSELPLSQLKKKLILSYEIVLNVSRLGLLKVSDAIKGLSEFYLVSEGNNAYIRPRDRTPSTCIMSPLNSGSP